VIALVACVRMYVRVYVCVFKWYIRNAKRRTKQRRGVCVCVRRFTKREDGKKDDGVCERKREREEERERGKGKMSAGKRKRLEGGKGRRTLDSSSLVFDEVV